MIPSRQDSPWPGCCPPSVLPRLPASRAGATSCLEVSVTGAATAQPRGCRYLSRELGQDWAGPSEQRRAFLSPRGGLSKRHLTSGQQTSPAFSSKKNFFCFSPPLSFSFLCPHLQPSLASLPPLTALKGKVPGPTPHGKVNEFSPSILSVPGGLRLSGQEGGNRRVWAGSRDGGDTVRALQGFWG